MIPPSGGIPIDSGPAKFLLILGLAAFGVDGWHHWHQHQSTVSSDTATVDENGFVSLPRAAGQEPDTVYVVAAQNCPGDAAQRADRLAEDLAHEGIPVVRSNNVHFPPDSLVGVDESTVNSLNGIMRGALPIVFINGRAKANASLDEVEVEFSSYGKK